ncbi:hypothetical protein Micbo1qcDRAFT_177162 [Microdochium bolleyi]|uniref:Uncharacterized protein n=1 Tax=Microdochium bolleyi TaxID=196109 RepID=A0A136IWK6_9PEZI|nr:hypothetical protein Micbo1qcDRAFT_177162 [Microdochium bolleyi]
MAALFVGLNSMTETEVFSVFACGYLDPTIAAKTTFTNNPNGSYRFHILAYRQSADKELSRTQLVFRDALARQAVRSWQIETKAEGTPAKVTGFDYARVVWGGLAATTGPIPRPVQGQDLLALDDEDLLANLRMMEKRSIDLVMVKAIVREIKPARETAWNGERAHPYPRR